MFIIRNRVTHGLLAVGVVGGLLGPPAVTDAAVEVAPLTTRVSVSSSGAPANGSSAGGQAISAGGRYVAFSSEASNLVTRDTNNVDDIFVRDRVMRTTRRVSVSSSGAQANRWSAWPAFSADGRYVVFTSGATNLVPGDTNHTGDVFLRDRMIGKTWRISVSTAGAQAVAASWDDGSGIRPAISADGRYVVFESSASNLVPGDTNDATDVFLRDRLRGTTRRVSVDSSGAQPNGASYAPAVSGDGRYVAFTSYASNLVPADTNNSSDVFLRDRVTAKTRRVSLSDHGAQANSWGSFYPAISRDGRYVAFTSSASNLVRGDTNESMDVFLRDRLTRTTRRISVSSSGAQADFGADERATISAHGRYVAFESQATNLVRGDTNDSMDVFLRDRLTRTTRRVSVSSGGAQANSSSWWPEMSARGRYVVFMSSATNLVPPATNRWEGVYLRDRGR